MTLTARVDAEEADPTRNTEGGVVAVDAGGRRVGEWVFAHERGTPWTQSAFVVPAGAVTGTTLTVTLGPRSPYLAPFPDYEAFSYWASQ